jgi:hypothetical protein
LRRWPHPMIGWGQRRRVAHGVGQGDFHVYGVFAGLVLDLEVEGIVEQPRRGLRPVGEVVRDLG